MSVSYLIANYGGKVVTDAVKQQSPTGKQKIVASEATFGPPLPGAPKFLHVVYSYGDAIVGALALRENEGYTAPAPKLEIVAALYGIQDVTPAVRKLVPQRTDTYSFKVENSVLGLDPNPGILKEFTIVYIRYGERKVIVAKEHDEVKLE